MTHPLSLILVGMLASISWSSEVNTIRLFAKNQATSDMNISSVDSIKFKSTVSLGQTVTMMDLYKSDTIFKSQNLTELDSIKLLRYSPSNRLCNSGYFTDTRDGQTYSCKTVGKQTWMTQNLNFSASDSWCYNNDTQNCDTYGRLYTQSAAYKSCPEDWHLPYSSEWDTLATFAGGRSLAGTKLLATSDAGTDDYGFDLLLAGSKSSISGTFEYLGSNTSLWTNSYKDSYNAYRIMVRKGVAALNIDFNSLGAGYAVRCVQDTAVLNSWTYTPEGIFKTPQKVSLSNGTPWSTIHYTLDGTEPTPQSPAYSGPISIGQGTTVLKAIAVKAGLKNSNVKTWTYQVTGTVATPTFNLQSGFHNGAQSLEIQTTTSGATLHYTLDGTTPTTSSPVWSGPIQITQTTNVKVLAIKKDWDPSPVVSGNFVIASPITDARDQQSYWTVQIGSQRWMAENLRYHPAGTDLNGSWCVSPQDPQKCQKDGRIYTWNVALALPSKCQDSACVDLISAKHQGICPSGWHIPSKDEWDTLYNNTPKIAPYTDGSSLVAKRLFSPGIPDGYGFKFTDNLSGFSAYPTGRFDVTTGYQRTLKEGAPFGFWSTTTVQTDFFGSPRWTDARIMNFSTYLGYSAGLTTTAKRDAYNLRCVQD